MSKFTIETVLCVIRTRARYDKHCHDKPCQLNYILPSDERTCEALAHLNVGDALYGGAFWKISHNIRAHSRASARNCPPFPPIEQASLSNVAFFSINKAPSNPLARLFVEGAHILAGEKPNGWRPITEEERAQVTQNGKTNIEDKGVFEMSLPGAQMTVCEETQADRDPRQIIALRRPSRDTDPEVKRFAYLLYPQDRVVRWAGQHFVVIDPKADFEARARVPSGLAPQL